MAMTIFFRKSLILLFSFLLLIGATNISKADSGIAEQFKPPQYPGGGYFGLVNSPDFRTRTHSALLSLVTDSSNKVKSINACKSVNDSKCISGDYWKFSAVFSTCKNENETNGSKIWIENNGSIRIFNIKKLS